ncbi:Ku protein, partial [Bryobacter aggregatus]|uniref:non-homologous end joining protein Ku n=1 Tax=Bryobacter aggregatus TaxID=360054 RepID=UPI0004E15D80
MASSVWSGHLTFGLVSFPVEIATAARRRTIDFDLLHRTDHSRIKYVSYCKNEDAPLTRNEIVKGYEYEKDKYVIIDPEELAKVAPQTAKVMEVLEFVDAKSIDPVYLDTSYYLMPAEGGEKPYSLLYLAMKDTGYSGIARLAMHNREHPVVIRAASRGLILHTMFYTEEIRENAEFRSDQQLVSEKERKLARSLVESLSGGFQPSQYHDAYREKVEALIQSKIKGKKVVATPSPKVAPVINILEALQKSLKKAPAAKKKSRVA